MKPHPAWFRSRTAIARLMIGLAFTLSVLPVTTAAKELVSDLKGGQVGKLQFTSVIPRSYLDLSKGKYDSSRIAGVLAFPKVVTVQQLPAVVIMHGSGGVGDREREWSELFLAQGWATLIVDSFTPRGIKQTVNDQSVLPYPASVADAYSALKILSTHPKINSVKIAVIGFSRGGVAALYSSIEHFRRPVVGSDVKFAAHVALYPGCSVYSDHQSGAPIRVFIGEQDSWEQPDKCKRYTDRIKAKDIDADTIVYQGVKHDFDLSSTTSSVSPRAETWKNCNHITNFDDGMFFRYDTRERRPIAELNAYVQACKSLGAVTGGDKRAREAVRKAVVEFITLAFKS